MTDKTGVVAHAVAQKPEEFKVAVVEKLNTLLRDAISDKRDQFAEGLVNKNDLTDKKPEPGTTPAQSPSAKNPGLNGHEQKDEKKTGDKVADEPKANGGKSTEVPD